MGHCGSRPLSPYHLPINWDPKRQTLGAILQRKLSAEELSFIARILRDNSSIVELYVTHAEIDDAGVRKIAASLEQQYINGSNFINGRTPALFSKAFNLPKTLRVLNLGSNHIGDDGTEALCRALYGYKSIESINLSSNFIGDKGAAALAKILPQSDSLETLDLQSNRIGVEGERALVQGICLNKALRFVSLHWQRGKRWYGMKCLRHVHSLMGVSENECYSFNFDVCDVFRNPPGNWLSLRSMGGLGSGSPVSDEEEVINVYLHDYHVKLRRKGQALLLVSAYRRCLKQISQELETVDLRMMPLFWQRLATTNGVAGVFSVLRHQPAILNSNYSS